MSLLLTGATGFLGRNILLRALSEGKEVLTAVRNADKLLQQLRFEKKNPQEIQLLSALPDRWPRISPRCAILGGGVLFERNRSDYFCTNVDWTLATLRALPPECRTVVISSQSAGGPTPDGRAARSEEDPDAPITWYGESKLAMERAIRRRVSKSADFDPASADDPWAARHGDASAFSNGSRRSPYQARTSDKIL